MGKIIARNMSSKFGFINKPLLLHLVGYLLYHQFIGVVDKVALEAVCLRGLQFAVYHYTHAHADAHAHAHTHTHTHTHTLIYTLLLPKEHMCDAWKPSRKQYFFGSRRQRIKRYF